MKFSAFGTLATFAMWPGFLASSVDASLSMPTICVSPSRKPWAARSAMNLPFPCATCTIASFTPRTNEEAWWEEKKLSPLPVAQELWATSRRHRRATALQSEFLRGHLAANQNVDLAGEAGTGEASTSNEDEARE